MSSYHKLYSKYKKLYSGYLKEISIILNNYHKKHHSADYWEPIIGLYLRKFIINYLFLNKVNKKKLFKKPSINNVNFYKNYSEFAETDNQFFYKFIKINRHNFYKLNETNFLVKKINRIISILPNILVKFGITKIFFQESYFKKNLKIFFTLRSIFYLNSLPALQTENYKIEKEKIFKNRLNLIKLYEIKNKKDFILQNIIFSMPINYIENYENILKEVKKIELSKGLYIDGNEVKFDFIKFYIAELILKKKKIFTGQHSLRSGLEDFDVYFDYSKSISNYYLSWGWNDKSNSIIKYSSTRIYSSLKKYKKIKFFTKSEFNVCFILCSFSKVGECLPDNYIENFKAEKSRINLLKMMKKKKNFEVTLKPRSGSFLIKNKRKFYREFNILKSKSRMYEILGTYNILVFERLSLGIAECMHLNQPAIFYYPKNLYKQKSKKLNELLILLKKANIYFDDTKKISNLLSSRKNISEWWHNKNNVKNRNLFLSKYANSFNFDDFSKIKKLI